MKKAGVMAILLSTVLLLTSCSALTEPTYKKYAVEETYKFSMGASESAYLTVLLPKSCGYQSVENLNVTGFNQYNVKEKPDCSILSGEVKSDSAEIRISYDVALSKRRLEWDNTSAEKSTAPEAYIDSDAAQIQKVAASLKIEGDDYKTAKNTAHFVSTQIKFDSSEKINQEIPKASEVLALGKGVCTDYANATAALLRANGIPAQSISGLVFNKLNKTSEWSHPGSSHAWVEFFANGSWHFADPTWGDRYFDTTDGFHLSYGTSSSERELYNQALDSYKSKELSIIGAMSAPLKFIAASSDSNASIVPMATVQKNK